MRLSANKSENLAEGSLSRSSQTESERLSTGLTHSEGVAIPWVRFLDVQPDGWIDIPRGSRSGTGLVMADTKGEATDRVYDDHTPFTPVPMLADRAQIDQLVMNACARGVRSVVLCNSLIYGHGSGLHQDSVMIPWLMRQARADGMARYIGAGRSIWSHVHIEDLIDLYGLALDKAPPGSRYLVENGETAFADIAQAIADIAQAIADRLGLPTAEPWPVENARAEAGYIYALCFGSSCRVRATRARAELGWEPKFSSLPDWIRQEA